MFFVRLFSIIGLGISAYFLYLKFTDTISSLIGCNAENNCANAFESRWSQIAGLPVSALALALYLIIFGLSFRRRNRSFLLAGAFLLLGAALWFMSLQAFVLEDFCLWCLGTHIVGILTAASIIFSIRSGPRIPKALSISIPLLSILVLGQLYGPSHIVTNESLTADAVPFHAQGDGPLVDFSGKQFRLDSLPHVGNSLTPNYLVKYFDYTNESCRDLHRDLKALREAHPGKVGIIFLPTPLNRNCNGYLPNQVKNRHNACELARISLAIWREKPERFAEAHDFLFKKPTPSEALNEFGPLDLNHPWINELITANTLDYKEFVKHTPRMPKLRITEGKVMSGLAKTTEQFIQLISNELSLP